VYKVSLEQIQESNKHCMQLTHARHGTADMMEAEAWNEPSVEPCPSYPEGGKANAYKNKPALFPSTFQTQRPVQ
jgi:hypothetical protein